MGDVRAILLQEPKALQEKNSHEPLMVSDFRREVVKLLPVCHEAGTFLYALLVLPIELVTTLEPLPNYCFLMSLQRFLYQNAASPAPLSHLSVSSPPTSLPIESCHLVSPTCRPRPNSAPTHLTVPAPPHRFPARLRCQSLSVPLALSSLSRPRLLGCMGSINSCWQPCLSGCIY